jgi:hypothetical protein
MDQDELLQDLALKLDLANMELQTIDQVLARRPALSGLKHRTEKIERACQVNGELLAALKALEEQVADFRAGRTWDASYIGLKEAHLKAKVAIQKAEGLI